MMKKLYLSSNEKILCGVCGGIAEYLNVDPTVIRLVWVLFSVFTAFFGGIVAYIIACMIIPEG